MKTLMSFFLSLIVAVHSQQCLKDRQLNLLDFKNSLLFNASLSSKLVSWHSKTDCCSSPGVSCSTNGSVVGLDISRESISGGFDNSSSLFDLQHLQSLSLAFNNFTGSQIPSATGKLTSLRYLNLSSAGFGGQIPIEISLLGKLVILDISYNQGLEIQDLSMLIQNLTELTELYLDNVSILSQTSDWSLAISSSLPNLKVLSLSNCQLSGPIGKSLDKLTSLSVIRLDLNKISSPIPGFIANFANLTTLSLRNCGLQGTFPKEIIQLINLEILYLKENSLVLSYDATNSSYSSFPQLYQLKLLASGKLTTFPDFLRNQSGLAFLDLSNNLLHGMIPNCIWKLNLYQLNLSCNSLQTIEGPLLNVTSPVFLLDRSYNKLQGQIPDFSSYYLDYSSNNFSSGIPTGADFCRYTSFFAAANNNLSGIIPGSICNSASLEVLDLSNNSFTGTLPQCFTTMSGLAVLDLSGNNVTNVEIPQNCNSGSLDLGKPASKISCQLYKFGGVKPRKQSDNRCLTLLFEEHIHLVSA
ncbi:hypothetical protein ACLB2K_060547 [Fragaria x ananassa]